jgi:hypothetical protein
MDLTRQAGRGIDPTGSCRDTLTPDGTGGFHTTGSGSISAAVALPDAGLGQEGKVATAMKVR